MHKVYESFCLNYDFNGVKNGAIKLKSRKNGEIVFVSKFLIDHKEAWLNYEIVEQDSAKWIKATISIIS